MLPRHLKQSARAALLSTVPTLQQVAGIGGHDLPRQPLSALPAHHAWSSMHVLPPLALQGGQGTEKRGRDRNVHVPWPGVARLLQVWQVSCELSASALQLDLASRFACLMQPFLQGPALQLAPVLMLAPTIPHCVRCMQQ